MKNTRPDELPSAWRERAQLLERYGDPTCARLWRSAAEELAAALEAAADDTLSLREAAAITGYSADHLGARIRSGDLPNAGRKGAPRLRRRDLPAPKPLDGPGRPTRPRLVPDGASVRQLPHNPFTERKR